MLSRALSRAAKDLKDMEQANTKVRFWQIFAAITMILLMAAAIRWSLAHPYGANWDEAYYLDLVAIDAQRLHAGMLLKLGGRLLIKSWGRPPANRLLAVPVLALFGFHTATARLVTLACFALTAWFIYVATKRIASQVAGAFAVLVFCLAPQVVSASIWFSSEGPLYLATSAMLYYLFVSWTDTSERSSNWIGLGLAMGLGLLSKSSFVLIGLPVLAFGLAVSRWRPLGASTSSVLRKAGILGLLIAGPWWALNIKSSITYARFARDFVRHSLGSPSPQTWMWHQPSGRGVDRSASAHMGHDVGEDEEEEQGIHDDANQKGDHLAAQHMQVAQKQPREGARIVAPIWMGWHRLRRGW